MGTRWVYLRDTVAETTTRVTRDLDGNPVGGPDGGSGFNASFSANGRYRVYATVAPTLVAGDDNTPSTCSVTP